MISTRKRTVAPEGWSARRSRENAKEKKDIAQQFAEHEFLVGENNGPERPRETAATILVVHGTSPDVAVGAALKAVARRQRPYGPFINWYSPGALVPPTLLQFRKEYPDLISATRLFLFPGEVDLDIEAACSDEAVNYAKELQVSFTYAFLGAYSCDLLNGTVYFQHPREVNLQRACALKPARQKVLFLDSSKFRREGHAGYTFRELMATSETVTLYTASKAERRDSYLINEFKTLANVLLSTKKNDKVVEGAGEKTLRICIVRGATKEPLAEQKTGYLKVAPVSDQSSQLHIERLVESSNGFRANGVHLPRNGGGSI